MRKINNTDKILKNMKGIQISSDPAWQADFTAAMERASTPVVTNPQVPRTFGHSLFNFLNFLKMGMQTKFATVAVVSLLILGSGGVAVAAADVATPGSTFYFLDTFGENISRVLTIDPIAKANLEVSILEERLAEVTDLQANNADASQLSIALAELTQQQERTQERVREMEQEKLESQEREQERTEVNNRYEEHLQEQSDKLSEIEQEHRGNSEVEDSVNEAQKKQDEAEVEMEQEKNSSQQNNSGTTENQEQEQHQEENKNDDNSDDRGREDN